MLLLCGVSGSSDLYALCERIRQGVEAHDWACLAADLQITVSLGAALASSAEVPATTLARADQALYQAKGSGRNQVSLALVG